MCEVIVAAIKRQVGLFVKEVFLTPPSSPQIVDGKIVEDPISTIIFDYPERLGNLEKKMADVETGQFLIDFDPQTLEVHSCRLLS